MGVSTDAQLYYGLQLPEDYHLPWDNDEYENDEGKWWIGISDHQDVHEEIWTPVEIVEDRAGIRRVRTSLQCNLSEEELKENWAERRQWFKDHPMPFDIIRHCSDGYTMCALAIPSTVIVSPRGHPKKLDGLPKYTTQEYDDFMDFCYKYIPDLETYNPAWWLSSWWG